MKRILLVVSALVLLGSGCSTYSPAKLPMPSDPIVSLGGTWSVVAPGIDKLTYQFATSTQAQAVIYRFSSDFQWRFEAASTSHTVVDWARREPRAVLVMNGVYFTEDGSPAGFLSVSGTRIGSGIFDADKSGAISLRPKVQVIDTALQPFDLKQGTDVAQGYPMLISNGTSALQPGSERVARRSFFGTDVDGHTYAGVISEQPVSLYALAHILEQTGIPWKSVINLDGGPSTGISVRTGTEVEVLNSDTVVPNILLAEPIVD